MTKHHKVHADKDAALLYLSMAMNYLDTNKFTAATFATLAADEVDKHHPKVAHDVKQIWKLATSATTGVEKNGLLHSAARHKQLASVIEDAEMAKNLPNMDEVQAIRERLVVRGYGQYMMAKVA